MLKVTKCHKQTSVFLLVSKLVPSEQPCRVFNNRVYKNPHTNVGVTRIKQMMQYDFVCLNK